MDVILIAAVDCNEKGNKVICEKFSVRRFPSLLTLTKQHPKGDKFAFDRLKRSFDKLLWHVETYLLPTCGPEHIDKCSEEQLEPTALISFSKAALDAMFEAAQAEIDKLVGDLDAFAEELDGLQGDA